MKPNFIKRTPWQITLSVWSALFLREAVARTTADRFGWFWMLAEPIAMVALLAAIRSVVMIGEHISGAEFVPWLITGMLGFFLFRENMMRSITAISANRGLFAYRQVKPIDPVLVRCYLEGMLKSFIFGLFIVACIMLGIDMIPDRPLQAFYYWACLWLLGAGIGITLSALAVLVSEISYIARIIQLPLMLLSGAILPLNFLPHDIQQLLLWNPIVHGVELLRFSFFSDYHGLNGVSALYLWYWILGLLTLGLSLHIQFSQRLKAQ